MGRDGTRLTGSCPRRPRYYQANGIAACHRAGIAALDCLYRRGWNLRYAQGLGFQHKRVHHAAKVYVEGDVHVNSLEGFWSLVKRGIGGVYHSVSSKHLQSYLSEYAWRYNHRNDQRSSFRTLLLRAARP